VSTGAGGWHKSSTKLKILFGGVVGEKRCFYQDLTEIAENRIKELKQQAEEMEAGPYHIPKVGSYFHACALTVYLAWRDVTDGLHDKDDLDRLEALTNGPS
jgi:hypothetical protein